MRPNTIYTAQANCQDCYRCVRVCPVEAIRVSGGQARIVHELCIQCGTCVRECPQQAKKIRSDLDEVKALLAAGKPVAASVAPSFAGLRGGAMRTRLPSVLRALGFRYVAETAEGAKYVTEESFGGAQAGSICTACPAVVHYVEKYRPELLPALLPLVSPMIAHGRMLKARQPGTAVVFIGPCAAKKEEILRPENAGAVDAVLTFEELEQWMAEEDIQPEHCADSGFDGSFALGDARLFPLEGGMLRTGGLGCTPERGECLQLSGAEELLALFGDKAAMRKLQWIEPLFCKGGCIGGPAFGGEEGESLFRRRRHVIAHWEQSPQVRGEALRIDSRAELLAKSDDPEPVPESRIQKILEQTGKSDPVQQLNCGACGYKTCYDNAIAIARDMAEPEMCVSYMRRQAQQRTDRIIETTPNGVVILDSNLCIIQMNPAFRKMFMCGNGVLGRRISYLVNAEGYEVLQAGETEQWESVRTKYGIRYHEILYALREEGQFVGLYSDISKLKFDQTQLDVIKAQTVLHAREFLDHQIRFAQEMAHYLGKSTAQSEEIARRLIGLYENGETDETL